MAEVEILKTPSNWGGKREGSGRKPSEEKALKAKAELQAKAIIHKRANDLIASQLRIALGHHVLVRIEDDGTKNKVTTKKEIEAWVNGETENVYAIAATNPNYIAANMLLDRGFGKPKQEMELGVHTELDEDHKSLLEEALDKIDELNKQASPELLQDGATGTVPLDTRSGANNGSDTGEEK